MEFGVKKKSAGKWKLQSGLVVRICEKNSRIKIDEISLGVAVDMEKFSMYLKSRKVRFSAMI